MEKRQQQQQQHDDPSTTTLTLSYAFSYKHGPQSQVREMFDEFFRQIHAGDQEIPESVRQLYVEAEKEAAPQTPTIEILSYTLCRVATALGTKIYIVIDALDECYPENREDMLLALKQLVRVDSADLRILVSSRDMVDLVERMIDLRPERFHMRMSGTDIEMAGFIRSLLKPIDEIVKRDSYRKNFVKRHRENIQEETMSPEWQEKLTHLLLNRSQGK